MKHNNFRIESEGIHLDRARTMAEGIAEFGVELGFSPVEIAEIVGYGEVFFAALSKQNLAKANQAEVNVELKIAIKPARKQFSRCRTLIRGEAQNLIPALGHYLESVFLLGQRIPRRNTVFAEFARDMLTAFDNLPAEHPEIAMPAEPFEILRTLVAALEAADKTVLEIRALKQMATFEKVELRRRGESMFRRVYRRALSFWGDDASKLIQLGIVPKSEIWTKKRVEER